MHVVPALPVAVAEHQVTVEVVGESRQVLVGHVVEPEGAPHTVQDRRAVDVHRGALPLGEVRQRGVDFGGTDGETPAAGPDQQRGDDLEEPPELSPGRQDHAIEQRLVGEGLVHPLPAGEHGTEGVEPRSPGRARLVRLADLHGRQHLEGRVEVLGEGRVQDLQVERHGVDRVAAGQPEVPVVGGEDLGHRVHACPPPIYG